MRHWMPAHCDEEERRGEERRGEERATEGEIEGDKCPMAFSSSLACLLLLRVLNTTAGPTSLHTTVQQIPGKYELVSTCTAQTNTGPLFFSFLSPPTSSFHFYSINTSKQHLVLLSGKNNLMEADVLNGEIITLKKEQIKKHATHNIRRISRG